MLLRRYKNRRASEPAVSVIEAEQVDNNEPVQSTETDPEKEETPDLLAMNVEELQAYAAEREIDLGRATSQEGIRKKIQDALAEKPE